LRCGLTSLVGYFNVTTGCTLSYTPTLNGFGTGTLVNILMNGQTVDSYKAVIFGDVNGDGNIDSIDAGLAVDAENYIMIINQNTGLATLR